MLPLIVTNPAPVSHPGLASLQAIVYPSVAAADLALRLALSEALLAHLALPATKRPAALFIPAVRVVGKSGPRTDLYPASSHFARLQQAFAAEHCQVVVSDGTPGFRLTPPRHAA